jgi:hypothetical protein
MKNIRTWKRLYKEAVTKENYDFIDQVIMLEIWGIKSICKSYEKYAKKLGYNNPLQADEQYNLSLIFANNLLSS